MELVGHYRKQLAISVVSIQLPWFAWVALSLLTSISIIVIGIIVLTHREISNPFSDFSDLLGDDAMQAALARGFSCWDTGLRSHPRTISGSCTQLDTDKLFSGVYMRMSGNIANEISFSLRENALTLGDLVLLWGEPNIQWYCETVVASWPARHITSLLAAPRTGQISYFLPILSVSFTRYGSSQWGRLLLNDALHNCGSV